MDFCVSLNANQDKAVGLSTSNYVRCVFVWMDVEESLK
jgi:hypothetical protein